MKKSNSFSLATFTLIVSNIVLFGCDSGTSNSAGNINTLNQSLDPTSGSIVSTPTPTAGGGHSTPTPTPVPTATPTPSSSAPVPISNTCVSSDANHICIGLKVVSYVKNNVPILTQAQAINLVAGMNTVWAQCNIGFQLEEYSDVDPATKGLSYDSDWENDGDTVRSKFQNKTTFLVVAVGSLTGSTIAVTEMPGAGVYGVLVESAYANNALTVGHEIGHYMGLYHISDNSNLMNPYIGSKTSALTSSQCTTSRNTDNSNWKAMMRK